MQSDQQRTELKAGRVLLLVLAALVLAGLSISRIQDKQSGRQSDLVEACTSLPGRASQLCSSYHSALGPDKFTAAVHWRQLSPSTYACSGITVECLHTDMHSNSTTSSCQVLRDGDFCDDEQQQRQLTCSQGFCGGRPDYVEPEDPDFMPGVSNGFAPVSFAAPYQSALQHPNVISQAKSVINSVIILGAEVTNAPRPRSLQAVSAGVNSGWPTAYGVVKFGDLGKRVPETFLGTSHEWTRLTDYGRENAEAWAEIFKTMSASPVLRIGGASQDRMVNVPSDATWIALAKLQKLSGARFIIGLPLFQKNAVEMSRQMMGQAKKYLGSSVMGYELGNEPEFWPKGLGGWDDAGKWQYGFAPYHKWFDKVARTLNPCGSPAFLSGPGWGNVNTQDPNWLKIFLENGKKCGYLWESNVHYYPYIDNTTVTADQLLAQDLQNFGINRLEAYLKIAQEGHKLPLRISEANSLYGGGRAGLSDTMAGALWVADALFAFANAGARAFHLHWGFGGLPFEGGAPNVGVQTNFDYNTKAPYVPYPSIHAPWYGYLFWVYSTAGGYNKNSDTQFVSAWVEKSSPTANKRVASVQTAKQTNPQTAKQTNSQTQQTQQKTTATNQKPAGKPQTAAPAKTQQNAKAPAKPAAAPAGNKGQPPKQDKKGRRLLAVQQNGGCDANIKIWALRSADDTLRLAILNKDSSKNCNMRISIPDAPQFCKPSQKAELTRLLPGPKGMASKGGISWQGQHYEDGDVANSGKIIGPRASATVWATTDADGCAYVIGVPKTSGALLILKAAK